jgi:hypothetical protein
MQLLPNRGRPGGAPENGVVFGGQVGHVFFGNDISPSTLRNKPADATAMYLLMHRTVKPGA